MKKYISIFIVFFLSLLPMIAKEDGWTVREHLDKAGDNLAKDPAKAIYHAGQALTEATSAKEPALIAEAQYLIANAYINMGDYVTSYEYLLEAERNCPPQDRSLKADIYLSISYSYQKIKDFDHAFRYLEMAQSIYEQMKDTASIARCNNNKGLIYIAIPDNNMAGKFFNESLRLNRAIGNKTGIAQNLNNMSFIDADPATTIEQLKEAVAINESLGRTWVLGENYNNLGYQYRRFGDYSSALEALSKAKVYADMTNAQIESQNMTGGLKNIEVNLMEKNIKTIRKEKEQSEREFHLRRKIAVAIIAILAAICIVVAVSYRVFRKANHRQKELMQKELDLNRKELENFAIYVRSRNEILSGIQGKIKEAYGMESDQATRHLKKLNSSISQFNRTNDEANKMIDDINSGFISKLASIYPDLSNSEKRLASLLRIGMSSKEISLMMSMEPKSVDMARYRLRKKLNLQASDNLSEFLGKI